MEKKCTLDEIWHRLLDDKMYKVGSSRLLVPWREGGLGSRETRVSLFQYEWWLQSLSESLLQESDSLGV